MSEMPRQGQGGSLEPELPLAVVNLTPEQILDGADDQVTIERVTGMLMLIYDIDATAARQLLEWRSLATHHPLPVMANRLFIEIADAARDDRTNLRSACDHSLLTAHERISPEPEAS